MWLKHPCGRVRWGVPEIRLEMNVGVRSIPFYVSASQIGTGLSSSELLIGDSIVRFKDVSLFSIYYTTISAERCS